LQVNIAFWGYQYITSTTEEIPPIAIIGVIGISFVIINSFLANIKNFYLAYKAIKHIKKLALSLVYMAPPLLRLQKTVGQDIISKEGLEAIADDLLKRMIEISEGEKTVDEFIDELKKESFSRKNIRPVEQNP
jgi:hypothetical protein